MTSNGASCRPGGANGRRLPMIDSTNVPRPKPVAAYRVFTEFSFFFSLRTTGRLQFFVDPATTTWKFGHHWSVMTSRKSSTTSHWRAATPRRRFDQRRDASLTPTSPRGMCVVHRVKAFRLASAGSVARSADSLGAGVATPPLPVTHLSLSLSLFLAGITQ